MEFASKGVAGAGLGLGIAGTALGVLNGGLGGILGGNNGWGGEVRNGCQNNCFVTQNEMRYAQELDAALANTAKLEAERYTDLAAISAYKDSVALSNSVDERQNANYKELAVAVASLATEAAVNKANLACFQDGTAREFATVRNEFNSALACQSDKFGAAISLESERRASGDEKIVCWTQNELNQKISGVLKIPGDQICCNKCSPCNATTPAPTV